MNPINDNNEQSDLAKLFIQYCECQTRMGHELMVMASLVRAMSEKITEIDAWNM